MRLIQVLVKELRDWSADPAIGLDARERCNRLFYNKLQKSRFQICF